MCGCDLIIIIIILLTDKKKLYIANANLFPDQLIRSWLGFNQFKCSIKIYLDSHISFTSKVGISTLFVINLFDMMLKMVEIKGELT